MDSLLQSMDLVENDDIDYFTTINDMWDFGGLQYRSAGLLFLLEYSPKLNIFDSKHNSESFDFQNDISEFDKDESLVTTLRNTFGAFFYLQRPFRQKFQSNFYSSLEYGFYNSTNRYEEVLPVADTVEIVTKTRSVISEIAYGLSYYPNTRTDLGLGASIRGSRNWVVDKDDIQDAEYETFDYRTELIFHFNYYISPKLRLSFSYQLHFDKLDNERIETKQETIRQSTSLTLNTVFSSSQRIKHFQLFSKGFRLYVNRLQRTALFL
ncbi:MAG: hypothetical protein HC831_27575 [Chloroflexia bacterium]|nr:hypothetical protein [Chloroflexia bacterium]